ncbi:hypothetical protein L1077_21710 [Pseudoalteromonas luteoviolacea]|uniref:hypothetical protein n=1 Tax=Pseudoalteromonas luteoviolacea TaxID=43657 RepID=UPI001F39FFD8|nr:hypothetical protein [Pseudoalteromonas luteoviolacea]MCF6442051.1 hypothetical protein [Pseudoalteromonas luteoviolacea]
MNLKDWIKQNPEKLNTLCEATGKAEATIRSYAFGYRRVPEAVAQVIARHTENAVSVCDAQRKYSERAQKHSAFALVKLTGNKTSKPLAKVRVDQPQSDKCDFVSSVMRLVS